MAQSPAPVSTTPLDFIRRPVVGPPPPAPGSFRRSSDDTTIRGSSPHLWDLSDSDTVVQRVSSDVTLLGATSFVTSKIGTCAVSKPNPKAILQQRGWNLNNLDVGDSWHLVPWPTVDPANEA